jgi:hypothetical protein
MAKLTISDAAAVDFIRLMRHFVGRMHTQWWLDTHAAMMACCAHRAMAPENAHP